MHYEKSTMTSAKVVSLGSGHSHIFMFTNCKDNQFQNKSTRNMPPPSIIELAMPLSEHL